MEAIALYDRIQDPIGEAIKIGHFVAASGMFGCTKAEQGPVIALTCMSERISLVSFGRTYHIVDGKLNKKALAIHAEFRSKGGKVKWLTAMGDKLRAEAEFTFEGETLKAEFTMEEAKLQGLIRKGSAWEKQPSNMLRSRLLSNAIAMLCPEIVAGLSDADADEEGAPSSEKQVFAEPPKTEKKVAAIPAPAAPAPSAPAPEPTKTVEPAVPAPPTVDAEIIGEMVITAQATESGKLTTNTIFTLQKLIGEQNWEKALTWLKAKGKIKTDVNELSIAMAQSIIDRTDKFLSAIGGVK